MTAIIKVKPTPLASCKVSIKLITISTHYFSHRRTKAYILLQMFTESKTAIASLEEHVLLKETHKTLITLLFKTVLLYLQEETPHQAINFFAWHTYWDR